MAVEDECSFCGASGPDAGVRLVVEPDVWMCSRCVTQCIDTVDAHKHTGGRTPEDIAGTS